MDAERAKREREFETLLLEVLGQDYDLPVRDDRKLQELEERLRERDSQIADFARRLADAVARPGGEASPEAVKRLRELEEEVAARTKDLRVATDALTDRDKRIIDLDRERERQDKWMGVLTEQLETLRETNRRLNEEATEAKSARERIRQLQNSALTKMRRALRKKEKPMPKPVLGDFAEA